MSEESSHFDLFQSKVDPRGGCNHPSDHAGNVRTISVPTDPSEVLYCNLADAKRGTEVWILLECSEGGSSVDN